MAQPGVAELMSELYFDESAARSVLIQIGMKPNLIIPFTTADAFWGQMVFQLDQGLGIADGIAALLAITATRYPGSKTAQALHVKYSGQPPPVTTPESRIGPEGPCPTLMLVGVDLPDEFLETIRAQLGSDAGRPAVRLQAAVRGADLGSWRQRGAVAAADPGDDADARPGSQHPGDLREIQIPAIPVHQPDCVRPRHDPYLLQSVPATMTPSDIAAAIVAETRAMSDRSNGPISTVIDAETDDRPGARSTRRRRSTRTRSKTRASCGSGTKAVAGSISPELRMEAAAANARPDPAVRATATRSSRSPGYDNEDLPNKLTFELNGPGLAPPEDLDDLPDRYRKPRPRGLQGAAMGAAQPGADWISPLHDASDVDVPSGGAVRRLGDPRYSTRTSGGNRNPVSGRGWCVLAR